jgi:hypothetical protein
MSARPFARLALVAALGASAAGAARASAGPAAAPGLEVSQILEKCAAARGGLEAWRKVETMIWSGHVERADGSGVRMPFVFEQKRPNLTRFEISPDGQRSVRVFDGKQGWKARPSASGRPNVEPYSEAEQVAARDAIVIDGPLLDAKAKGIQVTLEGTDEVEGRRAYRLAARLPSGTIQRVWVDAQSFLEVKYDRPARDAAGKPSTVAVYLRNYQAVEGVRLPFTIETGAPGGGAAVDRIVIERVALNLTLPDGMFARPGLRSSRRGVTVDTRTVLGPPSAPGSR